MDCIGFNVVDNKIEEIGLERSVGVYQEVIDATPSVCCAVENTTVASVLNG